MHPTLDGASAISADQMRAVHQLTMAVHRAESVSAFYDQVMTSIAGSLGADRASLLLFDPDGVMRFKAWRGLSESYRQVVEGHSPWAPCDVDAVPLLVPDVEADPDLTALLPVLRAEGIAACAFVPLIEGDQLIGKFMLYYGRPHAFSDAEVALAQVLAGHVGLAVQRQRVHTELHASSTRLAGLQRITAELSRAVGTADVAAVVLEVALAELGASTGSLCMIDGDDLVITASAGYDHRVLTSWNRFPIGAELPASEAVRTGRPVFLHDHADRARYTAFANTPVVGDQAYAIMPIGSEIPLGALVVGFAEPRSFPPAEQALLEALATQCATALGRAHLYEERERAHTAAVAARARLTFLAEASAALGSSLDYPATLTRVAELAVPRLADVCAIYLLEDQQVRLAALAHADPARAEASRSAVTLTPIRLDDLHGVGAVLRTGAAEVHDPFDEEAMAALARSPEHLEGLRALGLSAAVLVPLTARGRTIGALALGVRDGHGLAEDTLALAEQLAGRAGAAIDNARLYAQRLAAIQTLQASLLPPQLPTLPGLDLAARYVAGAAGVDVGGDFYDVFALDRNRSVVVLGDVCGRGVRAAGTALLIRHLIRAAAVHLPTPSAILAHLNRELLRHEHGHDRDPDFATAVLAVARPNPDRTATIELALAGHPRPLVRDCAGTVHPVGTPGALIGAIEQVEFTDTTLTMGPGSVLLCYTDGATERRGPGGFFGQRRLADVLATAHGDAARIAAAVETAVTAFAEDDLSDDLAVLVLRPSP